MIVGRCADYALSDYKNCIHLFIYGDEKVKTKRIMEKYNLSEAKAKDMIVKIDLTILLKSQYLVVLNV